MSKGMIRIITALSAGLVLASSAWAADIYKIVDEGGNVTFTDQPPGDGTLPMDLPPLSVIETNIQTDQASATVESAETDVPKEPTARELRRMYRDFRITQPLNEETFWGTANTVVFSWGSSTPLGDDMTVLMIVDGRARPAPPSGGLRLTLDRGEHQVYAELRDARRRRIVASEVVTFFVMQNTVR